MANKIIDNLVEAVAENFPNQKAASLLQEEISDSVGSQFNKLFGRQKPVHHILGGGKSADVLLWRNKKISAGVLAAATTIWVLFEWLNYNFLPMACFALVFRMIAQFMWANASGLLNRSSSKVPPLVLPNGLFVNIGRSVGAEVNRALAFLQDVATRGNLKQFLAVLGSLFVAGIIGTWCNFITVLYLGFVAAHTLPVLYEKYDDQVDSFVYQVFGQMQNHYKKIDTGFLSKFPIAPELAAAVSVHSTSSCRSPDLARSKLGCGFNSLHPKKKVISGVSNPTLSRLTHLLIS